MVRFQNMDKKIVRIEAFLNKYGIENLEMAEAVCLSHGLDVRAIVRSIQPICFDDACWAYTTGVAAALSSGAATASEADSPSAFIFCARAIKDVVRSTSKPPTAPDAR